MSLSFVAFASCEDDKNDLSENVKSLIGKTYQGYDDDLELQVTLIFDETSFSLYENYTLMGKGTYSESKGLVVLTFKAGDYKGIEESIIIKNPNVILYNGFLEMKSMQGDECCDDAATVLPEIQLAGAWQCTGISGNVGGFDMSSVGLSTDNTEYGKYTKLFSIYMIGTTTGYYYRVGDAEQFGNVASSLIDAASKTADDEATWKKFLSRGTYTAANGILTLTSNNGDVENFEYSVADGYLTLVSEGVDVTGGNETAANVTGVINSILAIAGRSETINTNAGIVYSYKKIGFEDLKNLFSKN